MMRWLASLYSDGTDRFVIPQFPDLLQTVTIRLRVLNDNPITKLFLRTAPEGEEVLTPMACYRQDAVFAWYQAEVTVCPRLFHYRFKIVTAAQVYWYNAAEVVTYTPSDSSDFRILAGFRPPTWLPGAVFYQIFPDTFCSGRPKTVPAYSYLGHKPVLRRWDEAPGEFAHAHSLDFFGGDLAGLKSKITYFQRLGVNALYLTPVFLSPSNHRYDVQDYFQIDPMLGSNDEFVQLIEMLHQAGIRIILDGVFNHSGVACRWFNKCGYYHEPGAYQSLQTPYSDFYTFLHHPDRYESWLGVDSLPKLNYKAARLREMIYGSEKSVLKFWLKPPYQIDGWRLDVANMTARQKEYQAHREIFGEMRAAVKSVNHEAYFMGEHFFDPADFLEGDGLDATMNYFGFTLPVRQWLSGQDNRKEKCDLRTPDLDRQLTQARSHLSWQVAGGQYNLVNCHDLSRLKTIVNFPGKNRIGTILLMTYLGVPSIFYGDELGLGIGPSTESTRLPMLWDEKAWNLDIWQFYHQLIALRKRSAALQKGGIKTLYAEGDMYAYARFYDEEVILIMLNRGDQKKRCCVDGLVLGLRPGKPLREFDSNQLTQVDQDGLVTAMVPAHNGMIWQSPLPV